MSEKSFFTKEFIKEKLVEKYEYLVSEAYCDIADFARDFGCDFEFRDFSMLDSDTKIEAKTGALGTILEGFKDFEALRAFSYCLTSGQFNQNHDFWFLDYEEPDVVTTSDDAFEILASYLYGFSDISIYNFFHK